MGSKASKPAEAVKRSEISIPVPSWLCTAESSRSGVVTVRRGCVRASLKFDKYSDKPYCHFTFHTIRPADEACTVVVGNVSGSDNPEAANIATSTARLFEKWLHILQKDDRLTCARIDYYLSKVQEELSDDLVKTKEYCEQMLKMEEEKEEDPARMERRKLPQLRAQTKDSEQMLKKEEEREEEEEEDSDSDPDCGDNFQRMERLRHRHFRALKAQGIEGCLRCTSTLVIIAEERVFVAGPGLLAAAIAGPSGCRIVSAPPVDHEHSKLDEVTVCELQGGLKSDDFLVLSLDTSEAYLNAVRDMPVCKTEDVADIALKLGALDSSGEAVAYVLKVERGDSSSG